MKKEKMNVTDEDVMTDEEVEEMTEALRNYYSNLKESNKNSMGVFFISFFFPIIGLIIYAVNIGKNDELAKNGSRGAIYGIVAVLLITIIIFAILSNM